MLIEWRKKARDQLAAIISYIAQFDPLAAEQLYQAIERSVSFLPRHPYLHRAGRVAGTREIVVHPNYIVIYRVTDRIEIVNVVHARRKYP